MWARYFTLGFRVCTVGSTQIPSLFTNLFSMYFRLA